MCCHTLVAAYERMARPSRARGPCPFSSNGTSCPVSQFAYYRLLIGARSTGDMRTVVLLLLTLAHSLCVYCILLTGPRDRRGRCEAVTYFTLVFRRRPTLVESEFLLAVFECECSMAWALARKLSRARPSTRECEASYSTLASRFRVSCNVRHRTVRVFELLACFMR
jgi:hypothetical protein